jgi:predicted nucleic acid-binding protein
MAVLFDASFLVPLLDPKVKGDGQIDARLDFLLKSLDASKEKVIIPTPALSEVLIGAGDSAPQYLEIISKTSRFRIIPFGERAAVEAAAAHREAIDAGDKKEGSANWDKVKFDRQILAIGVVEGVERIYSNDDDIIRMGKKAKIEVITLDRLPLPPEEPQASLF